MVKIDKQMKLKGGPEVTVLETDFKTATIQVENGETIKIPYIWLDNA